MVGDNSVSPVEVPCELCGKTLYFLRSTRAAEIQLGVGLHQISCRRSGSKFPLGMDKMEDFETEKTERDKGGGT